MPPGLLGVNARRCHRLPSTAGEKSAEGNVHRRDLSELDGRDLDSCDEVVIEIIQ